MLLNVYKRPDKIFVSKNEMRTYGEAGNEYLDLLSGLGEKPANLNDYSKAFFYSSGTEAVEGTIKIARRYGRKKGYGKSKILYIKNSLITGEPFSSKYQDGFESLIGEIQQCEFNNISDIYKKISGACAIMVEAVQGGLIGADAEFLKKLRELCDKWNCLLIFDEIQYGTGRREEGVAYEKFGVLPDVVCMANRLGGEISIGAILLNERADVFTPEDH